MCVWMDVDCLLLFLSVCVRHMHTWVEWFVVVVAFSSPSLSLSRALCLSTGAPALLSSAAGGTNRRTISHHCRRQRCCVWCCMSFFVFFSSSSTSSSFTFVIDFFLVSLPHSFASMYILKRTHYYR